MTTIHAILQDQNLTAIESPTIASGDRKTVQITVDFDSNWDGFIKSAVFFTSLDNKVYEVIMSGNTCTVPMEVLADKCYLFIGIRGNDSSGAVKTSTLIRYKIQEGSPVGDAAAVDPTPDVYQQILFAYEGTNDRVDALDAQNDELAYGEYGGGKNLFNGCFIDFILTGDVNYTNNSLSNYSRNKNVVGKTYVTFGSYLKAGTYTFSYTNNAWFSLNRIAIAGTSCYGTGLQVRKSYTWTQEVDGYTYFSIEGDYSETGTTDTPFSITPDIQIEKGTQATDYAPYIKSVKQLTDAQNDDLKMLGWTIPSGFPIKNYKANGVFHQRAGRVDLSKLNWVYVPNGEYGYFSAAINPLVKRPIDVAVTANMYCRAYNVTNQALWFIGDKNICYFFTESDDSRSVLLIRDTSYTDATALKNSLQGQYLYYELAQEVTMSVDGNEIIPPLTTYYSSGTYSERDDIIKEVAKTLKVGQGRFFMVLWNGNNYFSGFCIRIASDRVMGQIGCIGADYTSFNVITD